jgi:hypothetical protein
MPIRYRLLPFAPNLVASRQAAQDLLRKVGEFGFTPLAELSLNQWHSVVLHASAAGAQTILLQDSVRDPDFIEEYEAFYSKQQKHISKLCKRLHFFSTPFPAQANSDTGVPAESAPWITDTQSVLDFIDTAADSTAPTYIGFVTLRPLRHAPVGASILMDLRSAPALCRDEFPVHIAGRSFSVIGTPYLQQDNAVGACAQASIWVALRTLRRRVGNSAFSPAELTVAATKHYTLDRVFPGRQGLTTSQMLEAIRSAGHDPLIVALPGTKDANTADLATQFATPYLESGLPVIIGVDNVDAGGGHAIVAIGYLPEQIGHAYPINLTIHNDNTGCYLKLPQHPTTTGEYALSQCIALITPLPDGICMTAAEAERLATAMMHLGAKLLESVPSIAAKASSAEGLGKATTSVLRLFLSSRHSFRRWATSCQLLDQATRTRYRSYELPKFVWVAEVHDLDQFTRGNYSSPSRIGELVFDASADALHGDSLIFMRLSGLILGHNAPDDGLLLTEGISMGSNPELIAIKAPPAMPQTEPWN